MRAQWAYKAQVSVKLIRPNVGVGAPRLRHRQIYVVEWVNPGA
jgi:hypothetical protein